MGGHTSKLGRWSSFKFALKDKTIEKLESKLKDDVMILDLTLLPFFLYVCLYPEHFDGYQRLLAI